MVLWAMVCCLGFGLNINVKILLRYHLPSILLKLMNNPLKCEGKVRLDNSSYERNVRFFCSF